MVEAIDAQRRTHQKARKAVEVATSKSKPRHDSGYVKRQHLAFALPHFVGGVW